VLRGGQLEFRRAAIRGRVNISIPPVEFDAPRNAESLQPPLDPQRREEQRRAARLVCQCSHTGAVEVIVVVVRNHHDIDVRQTLQWNAGPLRSRRTRELHRRGARREHRIGQHIESARLHQHRRVTDPGHRGNHLETRERIVPDEIQIRGHLRRGHGRLGRQMIANPIQLPAKEIAE